MAGLINLGTLMNRARNLKCWMELRYHEHVKPRVLWEYIDDANALRVLHSNTLYGVENWNRTWRAWDDKPTPEQRERVAWRE